MKISFLPFAACHKKDCLAIFDSNCPPYFAQSERILFSNFLNSLIDNKPVYDTIKENFFYVLIVKDKIIGCAGFYTQTNNSQIRFSWGMILNSYHKKGLGTRIVQFRISKIKEFFPKHQIALDTSQHTFKFYQNFGFEVKEYTKNGYAQGLDKYEMLL